MGREEEPTDADLIRAAHRDPTAFPALYDRYARRAVGWARRDGVPEADVVDLVGELFAQAWRSLRRYRDPGDGSAGAWLHGILRHLVASYHRRGRAEDAARRRLGIELDYGGAHDEELPGERGDALDDALAELPPAQAAAVRLRVVDELAYEDIGLRLSCTPVAARKQVSLGLRTLRAALKEESR